MAHVEGCACSRCWLEATEAALSGLRQALVRERREREENNSYGMMRTTKDGGR